MTQHSLVRALVVAGVLLSGSALAQPTQVTFTGNLSNSGAPTNGAQNFVFTLFDAPTGGTQAWQEIQNGVVVNNGVVTTTLGAISSLNPTVLNGAPLYLEVTVAGQTLSPRLAFLSSPYSVRSAVSNTSATLGTLSPSDVQRRVVGTCSSGNAMQSIDASGNVSCAPFGTGDIDAVTTSSGLTGGGMFGTVNLGLDSSVQRRGAAPANMSCPAGQYVRAIDGAGNAACFADLDTGVNAVTPAGGISAVIAGRTLTLSNAGVISLTSANAFITVSPTTGSSVITANVGSVANTLAAGNHGHNFVCGFRTVNTTTANTITVTCAAGEQLTGGGCNSNGTLTDSNPFQSCPFPPCFLCNSATSRCSADSWSCTKVGGTSLTAYAFCCNDPIRGNVP